MKWISTTLFLTLFSLVSFGQDTLLLSKSQISEKLLSKNLQIKINEQEIKSAKADFDQSKAVFMPNISVSHTAITTTNPLMAFGSKLNQEILTAADFNPALLNDPNRTSDFATKFEIQQPLINVDGWYGRKAAQSKMQAYQLQADRSKEYLQLEASKAFMQLQLAYKAVEVLQNANQTAKANLKLMGDYYQQGLIQKSDLLAVELRVNEVKNQLQYAKSNVQNASDYLALLLGESLNEKVYKPVESLDTEIVALKAEAPKLVDSRKDFQAMQQSVMAYQNMYRSVKFNFLPRINAFGTYELHDRQLFGTQANGYLLGIQLSWNIFDGYKTIAKTQKAKAEYLKMSDEKEQYLAKSQLELNKTSRQLADAANKVDLANLSKEQALEAYRIRSNRFKQGLEKTTDLLQSETQLYQKELEQLQAVFEYNFTKEYLQFLTQ
ncbi:MAG: TolC family protein [Sphingobacteriales bacterium]|nr:TolC family protein [Sphingobacteriales bacterium]